MHPESDFERGGCFFESVDKNTGVIAVRATSQGIASMAEWRVRMGMGQKNEQDQARHATPPHATPRHATPRDPTPPHATPLAAHVQA